MEDKDTQFDTDFEQVNKNKERIIMIIATCMVLAALTITAMYMGNTSQDEIQFLQDDYVQEEFVEETEGLESELENVDSFTVKNPTIDIVEENIAEDSIGGTKISENTSNIIDDAISTEELVEQTIAVETIEEMMLEYDGGVLWPLENDYNLIMQYSMEKPIYFETLDQYKRNPAMLIGADIGTEVYAIAPGKITDKYYDAETGWTYEMELGGGFVVYYGQLGDLQKEIDTYVAEGDLLGYIEEPTKYYTLEGSHLYLAMTQDGEPVYPLEYVN